MKDSLCAGQLVRVVSPNSLREMNIIGIITKKDPALQQRIVWIPDISREMYFGIEQLEIVSGKR